MRRALARLAQSGLRAAASTGGESLPHVTRAAAISLMGVCQRGGPASQWAPSQPLHSSASWAAYGAAEYTVFYPESMAEVGETAPAFSLPGASCRVVCCGLRQQRQQELILVHIDKLGG